MNVKEFGHTLKRIWDKWWKEKEAGKDFREIMKPGSKIDLSMFSNLDSNTFLRDNSASMTILEHLPSLIF